MSNPLIRLNLGCGSQKLPGFINVDKFGEPDFKHDLEIFPWPWADSSVEVVYMSHVLEHLGRETDVYLQVMQELYRVCAADAEVVIKVPHPRHNHYLSDPTHVRPIIPEGMELFSKAKNRQWMESGNANTTLGLFLDVDFEVISSNFVLDPAWDNPLKSGQISESDVFQAIHRFNNVVAEIHMVLKVVKSV
uniref:Putative SAM-dependent methyltransferases n=1 Tax=Magnetococcus massalia (strain MO-1) TaxID=451514 RepID=A0A1S7LF94_MAGMO|nr:Putative SAM-dependent methyltransferases [Candidatus Magnetococcus massalia]